MRIALDAVAVKRVVPAPRPLPLPAAPAIVSGIVLLNGAPLPVIDPAGRGGGREAALDDRIVVVETPRRTWGLICEHVEGVSTIPAHALEGLSDLAPGAAYVAAGAAGEEGVVLLADPDLWLSEAEEHALDAALGRYRRESAA
jgi:chemotaxis signal transduction protein